MPIGYPKEVDGSASPKDKPTFSWILFRIAVSSSPSPCPISININPISFSTKNSCDSEIDDSFIYQVTVSPKNQTPPPVSPIPPLRYQRFLA